MTRKHFEAIANRIKQTVEAANGDASLLQGIRLTGESVADACASTNDRFDRARFLAACGLN